MICQICGKKGVSKNYCNRHYLQFKKYGKIISFTDRTVDDLNEIVVNDNYAEIILYDNKSIEIARAIIDIESIDKVKNYKWRTNKKKNKTYAITGRNDNQMYLHSLLLDSKNEIDHINGNSLDNRIENLRECSHADNCKNTSIRCDNALKITGVYLIKGFYVCEIQCNKVKIALGKYKDINKAIYCRIVAEDYLFKEYSRSKKPEYILNEEEKKEVYYKTLNKIKMRMEKILGN